MAKETGFYDYGWRNYMSDSGRWFEMDQLSEAYSSFSPYAYVGNNPVMRTDPDGRKWAGNDLRELEAEHRAWRNSGGGGGFASYFAGGGSGFSAEMNSYFGTGNATMNFYQALSAPSFASNTIKWWSGSITQTHYRIGDEIHTDADFGVLNSFTYTTENIDWSKTTSNGIWWVNTIVGTASIGNLPRTGFFKYNELWHQTKTRGISFAWQNKWKNPGAKFWRGQQIKSFQGARNLSTKLTVAGGALIAADIAMSGQVKASHYINGIMLGASTTGVGSIVAGVWFVADMGTGAYNYLNGDGFKTLSDVIDQSEWGQSISFEMYDGLY